MAKFQLAFVKKGDLLEYKLQGSIDEDSTFKEIGTQGINKIKLDFQEIDGINSCGVREIIVWLKKIPDDVEVQYFNCPNLIVDQMNMVMGFLKKGSTVHSFYTPYYCEKCMIQTPALFTQNREFVGFKVTVPTNIKCSNCKGPTELDVIEANYFKFLQFQA